MSMFRKATRKAGKIRMAIDGPSGCGKSHSSLLMAAGLCGPDGQIVVIDTERSSSELEVGKPGIPEFLHANLEAPFSPKRYVSLIVEAGKEAGDGGVVIVDSLSHAWFAEGGALDMKDNAARGMKGNTWAAWRDVTPAHNALVDAILQCPCHVIATVRTKTEYEVTKDGGKTKVNKVGSKPIQRDGLEYEFTVVLDMSIEGHIATSSKDRTSIFDGTFFKPERKHGEALRDWLSGAADPNEESAKLRAELEEKLRGAISTAHLVEIWGKMESDIARLNGHDTPRLQAVAKELQTALRVDDAPTTVTPQPTTAEPARAATREPDQKPVQTSAPQQEAPAPSGGDQGSPPQDPPTDIPPADDDDFNMFGGGE